MFQNFRSAEPVHGSEKGLSIRENLGREREKKVHKLGFSEKPATEYELSST